MKNYTSEYVMVYPSHYSIQYKINPYMGGSVDLERAKEQWRSVKQELEQHSATVHTVDPTEIYSNNNTELKHAKKLPDVVFAANHGVMIDGSFILPNMKTKQRSGEYEYVKSYMKELYPDINLYDLSTPFEGCADLYIDEFTNNVWAGYGPRSNNNFIRQIQSKTDRNIIDLQLTNNWFYHLDTCLFILDKSTALFEATAFSEESEQKIYSQFDTVYECDSQKNDSFIPCNSIHLPTGQILTAKKNKSVFENIHHNKTVNYVTVDEFEKGGGSIRCMVLPIK